VRITFGLVLVILRLLLMSGLGFLTYLQTPANSFSREPTPGLPLALALFSLVAAIGLLLRSRAALLVATIPFTVDAVIAWPTMSVDSAATGALLIDILAILYLLRCSQKRVYSY
jgi:hypothetical protein